MECSPGRNDRQRRRRCALRFLSSFALAFPVLAAVTGASAAQSAAPTARAHGRLEMPITGNGSGFSSGEPEIAINPVNPRNLFIDYATFPVPAPLIGPAPAHSCGGMVSMNHGLSWQPAYLPFLQQTSVTYSECEDGIAAFGPDGTLYAGGDTATAALVVGVPPNCPPGSAPAGPVCIEPKGDDPFARSADGGRTWTPLPYPMGSAGLGSFHFAPGSGHPVDTFDRPFVVVDQSTGIVYFSAANIIDHERFVTASADRGSTFAAIYAVDSPAYPQGGNHGSNIVAAHGVLAEAYPAGPAPGGCTATCLIFETSTDDGATWSRHIVPLVSAASQPRPFLASDLARPGHFALTVFDSTGTQNQVYTTSNSGRTWRGPALVAQAPATQLFKPWLSYGPSGQLVLLWRAWHGTPDSPTTPYDVWAAVGRVEGDLPVFGAPVRVSSVAAPYGSGGGGDDFSFVAADHAYVHAAWGDSRSGATQVWYSRIPLEAFERHS